MGDAPDLLLHSPSPLLPLERAGSSQTQGLPATSKPAATKRKRLHASAHTEWRQAQATLRPRKRPYLRSAPRDCQTTPARINQGGANANNKPRRFATANSEPPRRTARCNHLMDLPMPSMPGKPRPASSSHRRAQDRSLPARYSSCRSHVSWRAGPWCSR